MKEHQPSSIYKLPEQQRAYVPLSVPEKATPEFPAQVLDAMLARIDESGQVLQYDQVDEEWSNASILLDPVDPNTFDDETYRSDLKYVRNIIADTCEKVIRRPELAERYLERSAPLLTSLREAPAFLKEAIQLVRVDDMGKIRRVELPYDYVPKRQQIT